MTAPEERLRVAVLADTLTGGGGMARYVRELLVQLGQRDDVDVTVIVPRGAKARVASLDNSRIVDTIELPTRDPVTTGLWERYRLGSVLLRRGVQVVHGTKHLVPRTPSPPTVLTVHDMFLLTWPSMFKRVKRWLLPRQYRASLVDADVLVAVSDATAARLVELEPELAPKVVVAQEGVSLELLSQEAREVGDLVDQKFALVVGDLSPRKNLDLLIDIWREVHTATGAVLVSAGPDGWRSEEVSRRFQELVNAGIARRLRDVPDPQLRWCYEQAHVVLMPTLEEGFGLPIVEALASGARVVASDDPALVEVARGHAQHLDPRDRELWTRVVIEVLTEPKSTVNVPAEDLPSWRLHTDLVVDAYRRAVATGGP